MIGFYITLFIHVAALYATIRYWPKKDTFLRYFTIAALLGAIIMILFELIFPPANQ